MMGKMEERRIWQAKWIWTEGLPRTQTPGEHQLVYFRRTFSVNAPGDTRLIVHVSADSRYRLYLNGKSVSVGPCKGNDKTHYYETVDLTDRLKPGTNVLAAKVLYYTKTEPFRMGIGGPISVWRSGAGGFFLEGELTSTEGTLIEPLHTNQQWKCLKDTSLRFVPSGLMQWLGGVEQVSGNDVPFGWEGQGYDDSTWQNAVPFFETRNPFGELPPWNLTPRPIPQLYETDKRFSGITRSSDAAIGDVQTLLEREAMLTLAPGTRFFVELDAGELSTGYLQLALAGGRGSTIRIICAECYEEPGSTMRNRLKGVRDRAEDGVLVGDPDTYHVAGIAGEGRSEGSEVYEPFWFRTFRYVRLEAEVGDEPLTIQGFHYRDTGYPLEVVGDFQCSDPQYRKLWDLALTTLRRCMHETYEDCPYYEQLQYTMDTELQMLFTYNVSGDDRLARKTLYDYHTSMLPSGMLQCRYPSVYPQVIPSFSLYWIHMLHDHYLHYGDLELIKRYRPTMSALLDWFERQRTAEGIVGVTPFEFWTFFDWVDRWHIGAPQSWREAPVTLHSLMYAVGLHRAADLFEATGWKDVAEDYRHRAEALNDAVRTHCWSEERQLFRDVVGKEEYSQHGQIWSVLSGAVKGEAALSLMERVMEDASLARVSLPMSYYLFRALAQVGRYGQAFQAWDRWKVFLSQNLTTLPEIAHDVPRSDCHAWSALPLSEFPSEVLGVKPGAPGYGIIEVAPQVGPLDWAEGTVATKHGPVRVRWEVENERSFSLRVESPEAVPVRIRMPDGKIREFEHGGVREVAGKLI